MRTIQLVFYDEDDLVADLTERISRAERAFDIARQLGISGSYLSDIVNGRRGISDLVAKRMGYEATKVFVRKGEQA